MTPISRRTLLHRSAQAFGALGVGLAGGTVVVPSARAAGADDYGPLQPANSDGLMLPVGFSSRIVAVSGSNVSGTSHSWHYAPDGGATYPVSGNGWVYVSNSERGAAGNAIGGVGAIRFDSGGNITSAYSILNTTKRNCAGGPTPWKTWLSCEEIFDGKVYECDPFTPSQGVARDPLGWFQHEAVAVDEPRQQLYLTEDQVDGLFYRFTPTSYPDLTSGILEVAEILDPLMQGPIALGQTRDLVWHPVLDPNPTSGGVQNDTHMPIIERATRYQVPNVTIFNGGEGIWYGDNFLYFSTKGDDRIWKVNTATQQISIYYESSTNPTPSLKKVDNVYLAPNGDVYVAEDMDDLQIVALTPSGGVVPIVQITGVSATSEVTGPCLSPDGSRLYFSNQRTPGRTYEVTGPFLPASGVPALGSLGQGLLIGAMYAAARALRSR